MAGGSGGRETAVTESQEPVVDLERDWQDDPPPVAVAVDPVDVPGVFRRGRQRILICGHSYVFWAAHQARRTPVGSQLGLSERAEIEWRGRRGLRWSGLLPVLFGMGSGDPPHILVVHLGANDLGLLQGKALSSQALSDMRLIVSRWPGVLIMWSAMIPRRVWREAEDRTAIERARMKANRAIQKGLGEGLGVYLPHPRIRAEFPDLYRGDGVHLSQAGNVIFLTDLRQGLELALGYQWGARA
ncbi:uncharacterized protein LOC129341752 [Eublepharis macularius]|uniref:Uncharacterized protein LOC129325215 n=1 Tax=Eublepharis macularius TaxID=481883 RepID=A0AA97KT05_EUBMA|nr:uncharacterized protein LOC129325215 [Eublepharis macularius]XP_054853092.1 uncharacterized protein LOC129341752 [Eublepharis macularius]